MLQPKISVAARSVQMHVEQKAYKKYQVRDHFILFRIQFHSEAEYSFFQVKYLNTFNFFSLPKNKVNE